MEITSTQYNKIQLHPLLNSIIDRLTVNQFSKQDFGLVYQLNITTEELRKCIWLSSILATSPIPEHQKKVQLFSSLLFLNYPHNPSLNKISYLLYSRSGNLTASKFLTSLFSQNPDNISLPILNQNFGGLLDLEMDVARDDKIIQSGKDYFITTNFQKELWEALKDNIRISISAPTSAGKSFIIKKFIKEQFFSKESFHMLYIVPSRALLSQVSEELREDLDIADIEIRTAYIDKEYVDPKSKLGYILTPERCLRLLQEGENKNLKLDLIFVDEIQNVEDELGRGAILEYVLGELANKYSSAKIISAGPNIKNANSLFSNIFSNQNITISTEVSPVFQIATIITPGLENSIHIKLRNLELGPQNFEIPTQFNLRKKLSEGIGEGLPELINLLAKKSQNIIYAPRTDYAENWALKYAENNSSKQENLEPQTNELIAFLVDEIHPQYSLIKCLKQKSAFHHSKLPDIVRKEIEESYSEGRIQNIFCTSTLLEGVNLPANNLFVVLPRKRTDPLTSFEFGNLIGRAGRVKDSLYGTIFCLEHIENESRADDYYGRSYGKNVLTSTEKSFTDIGYFISEAIKPLSEVDNKRDINTIVFLRHKFLKSKTEFTSYLLGHDLPSNAIKELTSIFSTALKKVKIPISTLSRNPSIDPILQNHLYERIKKEGLDNWIIHPNKNFYKAIKKDKVEQYEFKELSFYWQLTIIVSKIDSIFFLEKEAYFKHSVSISVPQMCSYGMQWLDNLSYGQLIAKDIKFYSKHFNEKKRIDPNNEKDINNRINQVIKINSTIVTYVLVKYLKLLSDLLLDLMSDEQKEEHAFFLALPTMMELGTTEPIVMQLISHGISRSVALKVFKEFKKIPNHNELDVFQWLSAQPSLNIPAIYNRYLRKLRLLKVAQ